MSRSSALAVVLGFLLVGSGVSLFLFYHPAPSGGPAYSTSSGTPEVTQFSGHSGSTVTAPPPPGAQPTVTVSSTGLSTGESTSEASASTPSSSGSSTSSASVSSTTTSASPSLTTSTVVSSAASTTIAVSLSETASSTSTLSAPSPGPAPGQAGSSTTVTTGSSASTSATGFVSMASGSGRIDSFTTQAVPFSSLPSSSVAPFGWWSFKISGLAPGETVIVTLTFSSAIPAGAHLYKSDCGGAGGAYAADGLVQSMKGNTMTISLTDGARGDCDSVPGQITDPQGLVLDGQTDQNPLDVAQFPIGVAALLVVALPLLLLARRRSALE